MSQTPDKPPSGSAAGAGDAFFARAEEVAETGNWDFAIQMYLDGIRRDPDNVERGHEPLRRVALNRKAMGGKGAGMVDRLKARPGKDPLENLIKAERVLAKEPGSVEMMQTILRATLALELHQTLQWIGMAIIETQKVAPKPNKRVCVEVAEAFASLEVYARALEAADLAKKADPDDAAVSHLVGEMSSQFTIQKGKYGQEGDFSKGVKDMDRQKELIQQDSMIQDKEYLASQVEKARAEYLASPAVPGKINAYVEALLKFEDDTHENQAIETLTQATKATGSYQFKMRIGDIRIRQMTRAFRKLKDAGKDTEAGEQARGQLAFELEEYAERAVNYPTDLSIKYELGKRQYMAGRHDDAIASLQQASNDPRRRLSAMTFLGLSFAKKGWLREAAETYERALEGDAPELRTKDLLYNLGDVLEKMDEADRAQDAFSRLAQIDFQYKDVRERLDRLRKGRDEGSKT